MRGIPLFIFLTILAFPYAVYAADGRIVSVNACTDEWLLQTVPPEKIAGVTRLNHSAAASAILAENSQIERLPSSSEAILNKNPSIVLTGLFSNPLLIHQLKLLNIRVISVDVPRSWDELKTTLHKVADAAEMKSFEINIDAKLAALETLRSRSFRKGKRAVFWSAGGHLSGRNTFEDEFIRTLGMVNAAEHESYRFVSLEKLIELKPDVIIVTQNIAVKNSWSHETLFHPVLLAALPGVEYVRVPEEAVSCASGYSLDVIENILKESHEAA